MILKNVNEIAHLPLYSVITIESWFNRAHASDNGAVYHKEKVVLYPANYYGKTIVDAIPIYSEMRYENDTTGKVDVVVDELPNNTILTLGKSLVEDFIERQNYFMRNGEVQKMKISWVKGDEKELQSLMRKVADKVTKNKLEDYARMHKKSLRGVKTKAPSKGISQLENSVRKMF